MFVFQPNPQKARRAIRIVIVVLLLGLTLMGVGIHGCLKSKKPVVVQEEAAQFPLNATGTVTGNNDGTIWFETINHQVYEYNLCSGPNLLSRGEGGSITFSWNAKDGCYVEESATHNSELDTKSE